MKLIGSKGWTLEEGLHLIRALQPEVTSFGYHLTLGGSVLNLGESDKDIDLYFLPLGRGESKPVDLLTYLQGIWGPGKPIQDYIEDEEELKSYKRIMDELIEEKKNGKVPATEGTYKFKRKFIRAGGDRIDVFIA